MKRFSATMDILLTFTRQLGFFIKILNAPWWVSNHHSLYLLILNVLGIMLWSYQHDQKWNNEKAKYKQKMATRREDTFNVNNKNTTLHGVHNKGSFTQQQSLKNILVDTLLSVHLGLTTCTDWELGAKDRFYHWSCLNVISDASKAPVLNGWFWQYWGILK